MPEIPIIMPQLGESIAEATIVNYLVNEGDTVQADQDLIEVETNKANMNVASPCRGRVQRFLAKLGESLGAWSVGARINDCLLAYATYTKPHPVIDLTHEKLSILVGTAREVVTRHLSRLEREGIIRVEPGQIVLLNVGAIETPCLAAQQDS